MIIPFNKPLILGTEMELLSEVFETSEFSANGPFTEKCQLFLETELGYEKALLTTSCTSALEMAAMLLEIQPGDEVIVPSYAFVTTANAFANRGAKIVFADSRKDHPVIDETRIDELISSKTKAIVALHYGGMACNMDAIMTIARKHDVMVVEDNAQGIGSKYNGNPLGGIADLGTISFHESKNIHCGEGGAILINNRKFVERAQVLWDMGTDRAAFRKGKVKSYGWVDVGSSFYPSELNAAFLFAQLGQVKRVNDSRRLVWNRYNDELSNLASKGCFSLPFNPTSSSHNAHIFYLILESKQMRDEFLRYLMSNGIAASFHFQSLHRSSFFASKYTGVELINSDRFSDCLLRLPIYFGLTLDEQRHIIASIEKFYE